MKAGKITNPEPSQPDGGAEEEAKDVVVSVRFPRNDLKRIQAFAKIKGTSANDVIRVATLAGVAAETKTPEFQKLANSHIEEARAKIRLLFGDDIPEEILVILGEAPTSGKADS